MLHWGVKVLKNVVTNQQYKIISHTKAFPEIFLTEELHTKQAFYLLFFKTFSTFYYQHEDFFFDRITFPSHLLLEKKC
jgi:hypothetical protein